MCSEETLWDITYNLVHLSDELRCPGQTWEYVTDGRCLDIEDAIKMTFNDLHEDTSWVYDFIEPFMDEDGEVGRYARTISKLMKRANL